MDYAYKSTYDYAENSPVANIDLDGLEAVQAHLVPRLVSYYYRMQGDFQTTRSTSSRIISGNSGNTSQVLVVSNLNKDMIKIQGVSNDVQAGAKAMADVPLVTTILISEGGEALGDGIETAGIALGQPEVAAVGAMISEGGTFVKNGAKTLQGESTIGETTKEVGKTIVFGELGKIYKPIAGGSKKDSNIAESTWNGMVKAWEELVDYIDD